MNAENFHALTGYQFSNEDLLQQALTHRSVSRGSNNERLEFLGDSVLNLVISNHIYHRFADADEGHLSRIRASLVKQPTLARLAREIDLGDHINLGGGELKSGGYRRASILSDALEALIGAVYLDSNYAQTETVVLRLFQRQLDDIDDGANLKDPKTRLQEYLQALQKDLPVYQVEQTTGKSHSQIFAVSCQIAEPELQGNGSGSSRKKAEQQAAQQILDKLGL
ncbi:MAG: ribonuclease III [Gammaproteobacteria bacterium]|nr:ribonuclease III [Gammaproteobacteria bacterium]